MEEEDEYMMDEDAHTGVVLCLGVPAGVEFGLDMTLWQGELGKKRACMTIRVGRVQ